MKEEERKQLVELFYPLVELTLFNEEGGVIEVMNAFSHLKEDREWNELDLEKEGPFVELLAAGRHVRCLISPISTGGYQRLRFDLTFFKGLQEQLNALMPISGEKGALWKESIDRLIADFHAEHKTQATTAKEKRELITQLQSRGLFDFKESSAYVASKLGISRATVYNYLKTASCLKKIHIHQVDAFTNERFGGNPAGVVLDAGTLDEQTMRKITRELNLSETAFVVPSAQGDFGMRYFTPTGHEIAFCGHSTVGALYMIAKEQRYGIAGTGDYTFAVETACGVIAMEISISGEEEIRVAYEAPAIKLKETEISHEELARAAGIDPGAIAEEFPLLYEETNKDLFVVIRSLEELKKIECDSKSLAQFSKQHGIVVLCALTPEAFDRKNLFHLRCFAPMVGVAEDPFTGSVLGGLAAYADKHGLLPKGTKSFSVEQGHFLERPGTVLVQFSKKEGNYAARVVAQAVHCFSTEINL